MKKKLEKLFRKAIKAVIEQEGIQLTLNDPFVVEFPRTFFLVIIRATKTELSPKELEEMREIFPDILEEFHIKIAPGQFLNKIERRKKFPKKPSKKLPKKSQPAWLHTKEMIKGAMEADSNTNTPFDAKGPWSQEAL
ncbi:hypothetical protein KKH07_00315 [Patescibacteria group bacterium]|nr:hypothetical protein [Patescibacteria group bacterium]MBU1563634.1 hypothetical protein [Patescibacteria group bacterium]